MYFWTLPGPEGAVLGGAAVAVETSLTMGCTLGTVVVTGDVVVEPEPGAEVLRDRTWGKNGKSVSIILHPHYSPDLGEYLTCSNQIIRPLIHPQGEKLRPLGPWEVLLLAAVLGPEVTGPTLGPQDSMVTCFPSSLVPWGCTYLLGG